MTQDGPERLMLDVYEFKRKMCAYLRRLQAGEVELLIQRYRTPIAVILSTDQMRLRQEARAADAVQRLQNHTRARLLMERHHILLRAWQCWPAEKYAYFRA